MYLTSSVGTVYAGEGVTVLAEEDDSYYIEYSTSSSAKRGYVAKSSIQTEGYETCTGVLNTNATVYYGKGTSYGRVGTIYSGEYVSVLASDGTWTYVEYNSPGYRKRGYIPTSSLQIIGKPDGMKSVYKATEAPETWGMYNFGSIYAGPSTQYATLLTVSDPFTEVTVTSLAEFNLGSYSVEFVEFNNNGTNSQKVKVYTSTKLTVLFPTTLSNYEKAIEVKNSSCDNEGNVQQNTRDNDWNQEWLLEPVTRDFELGAHYAVQNSQENNSNYSGYISAYPKFSNDCTNFISQCLLTSGFHYENDWAIYRKNDTYNEPQHNWQVNWSWNTTIPGPWMTANNFKSHLITKAVKGYKSLGSQITADPSVIWNLDFTKGTVVQIAHADTGEAFHSIIISDYVEAGETSTYLMSYHSVNTKNKSLIELAAGYPDSYFLFYVF